MLQNKTSYSCYNLNMKKILLYCSILALMMFCPAVNANEMTDDYLDIATSYAVSGNYASSMDYLDKILSLEPDNKEVAELKTLLRQLQSGNTPSPIATSDTKLFQAQSALKTGNKTSAMQLISQSAAGGGYWQNMFAGHFFRKEKQYQRALQYYQAALNATTQSSAPLLYIGICYFEMKNYNEAYPILTRFIAYNQQESYAYAMRARVATELGRYNDAETDVVTAIALEDTIEYRYLEGLILFKRGNFKKAQTSLEKIASQIQTSDVYKFLGLSYYATGDLNNALINLDKAIILSDDDVELKTKYNEVKAKLTTKTQNGG